MESAPGRADRAERREAEPVRRAQAATERGFIAGIWLYGLAAVAALGALYGIYWTIDSRGYERGRLAVIERWEAANREAAAAQEAERRVRARLADEQSKQLATAEGRAREAETQWRRARAAAQRAAVPLVVATCPESDRPAAGAARELPAPAPGGVPEPRLRMATSIRFTAQWLSEWDAAWLDEAGQPFWPNPGIPAATASQASTVGPEEVLANHAENAASCSEDRRRYGKLIDLIEKLRAR